MQWGSARLTAAAALMFTLYADSPANINNDAQRAALYCWAQVGRNMFICVQSHMYVHMSVHVSTVCACMLPTISPQNKHTRAKYDKCWAMQVVRMLLALATTHPSAPIIEAHPVPTCPPPAGTPNSTTQALIPKFSMGPWWGGPDWMAAMMMFAQIMYKTKWLWITMRAFREPLPPWSNVGQNGRRHAVAC